jgi:hypothetical protein
MSGLFDACEIEATSAPPPAPSERDWVLRLLRARDCYGATVEEVAEISRFHSGDVGRLLAELERDGLAVRSGRSRPLFHAKGVGVVWVATLPNGIEVTHDE